VRVLHAIHDFLPRHQAGSEIYAFELCRALQSRHHVTVVSAEFDVWRRHGSVRWRVYDGLPVVEIVNNWACASFEETYRSPVTTRRLAQVLRAVQPDILHVHSLMNLSFDLPELARSRGIPVVATLHDYSLVCAAGGQRIHRADAHLCHTIDPQRCARCVPESPVHQQMSFAAIARATGAPGLLRRAALAAARRLPRIAERARRAAARAAVPVTAPEIEARLAAARRTFDHVDLFVAPSASLAGEFELLGVPSEKLRVSDYGLAQLARPVWRRPAAPLRIAYVGTIVWHKGVHTLIDAVRRLPHDAYQLTIFGDPEVSPDYSDTLRRSAEGLPVGFAGPFPRARAAEIYAQIDLLVVPSLWLENSPLVIHEAFMAGVPVIGARIGGIRDLVADRWNGVLFEPGDAGSLEQALRPLVDDAARVAQLAANVPLVKSIDEDARQWADIYTELACAPEAAAQVL